MLREDNIVIGFAVGVMVPVLVYLAITFGLEALNAVGLVGAGGNALSFRPRTTALISICAALLPFRYYASLRNDASMRGVLIATALFAIGWFLKFGTALLNAAE